MASPARFTKAVTQQGDGILDLLLGCVLSEVNIMIAWQESVRLRSDLSLSESCDVHSHDDHLCRDVLCSWFDDDAVIVHCIFDELRHLWVRQNLWLESWLGVLFIEEASEVSRFAVAWNSDVKHLSQMSIWKLWRHWIFFLCECDVPLRVGICPRRAEEEFFLEVGSLLDGSLVFGWSRVRELLQDVSVGFMRILKHCELWDVLFFLIKWL